MRDKATPAVADGPPAIVPAPRLAPIEATRRWAALLQQIFEVDPLACASCQGAMRTVAFITQTSVIDQILTHHRTRASREAHAGPRSPPSTRAPTSRGPARAPRPSADAASVSPEDGPDAPPPRGDLRPGRRSHRRYGWVPAGIAPPTVTAVPTALEAHEHVSGHAAARQSVLTRSVIAPDTRPILDR
jgi:hypothetical protein